MIKYSIYHEFNGVWYDGHNWTTDRSKAKFMNSSELDETIASILKTGRNVDIKAYNETSISTYKLNQKHNWSAILEDLRDGCGRISIFIGHHEYSYTWGAMGNNKIRDFIIDTDTQYFCNKLVPFDEASKFSINKSLKTIRKYISEEYPYYEHMDFQKCLREQLLKLNNSSSPDEFINDFQSMVKYDLDYNLISIRSDRVDVESFFESLSSTIWEFTENEHSSLYKCMAEIHKRLKSKLEKERLKQKSNS